MRRSEISISFSKRIYCNKWDEWDEVEMYYPLRGFGYFCERIEMNKSRTATTLWRTDRRRGTLHACKDRAIEIGYCQGMLFLVRPTSLRAEDKGELGRVRFPSFFEKVLLIWNVV